jgi:hypothetical protein
MYLLQLSKFDLAFSRAIRGEINPISPPYLHFIFFFSVLPPIGWDKLRSHSLSDSQWKMRKRLDVSKVDFIRRKQYEWDVSTCEKGAAQGKMGGQQESPKRQKYSPHLHGVVVQKHSHSKLRGTTNNGIVSTPRWHLL